MQVKYKPCGDYQTNCYIIDDKIIIDPGMYSFEWVKKNVKDPIAILLTHGHFDHVWDVNKIKNYFNIPAYIHKNDEVLVTQDVFNIGMPSINIDYFFENSFKIENYDIIIKHFPGHTPGSCTIEIGDFMFSGDFIFKSSIGRFDFPYSNINDMKNSLKKFLEINYDKIIYPGHGDKTTIKTEQKNILKYGVL